MFNLGKSKNQEKVNEPVQEPQRNNTLDKIVSTTVVSDTSFKTTPQKDISLKTTTTTNKMNNIIGKDTEFEGTIKSQGTIQIEGNYKGTINSEGKLILAESGTIEGDIFCKDIELAGEVSGNVKARGKVTIKPGAKVKGDVRYYEIEIESGANIACTISRMNPENSSNASNSLPKQNGTKSTATTSTTPTPPKISKPLASTEPASKVSV